jgi:demethylmenaquinone methyltransferase / 2-methoxy-6-polyprenyl-1,4-benzoquinol methylase
MTLRSALSSADAKAPYVRRLFHTIADRYDLITRLLSFGRDRRWKAALVALADVRPGMRALDLAAGTGDIAFGLAADGAHVAGLDITHRMLQIASAKRPASAAVTFVTGDMMALPFRDETFDLVTTGYGIRNVPAIDPAIAEIRRVLRPGGLLLSLDFDRPANPLVRGVYLAYLTLVGSALGWVLHRDPDTYRYIPESIRRYPGAAGVAAMLSRAGFDESRVVPLLGGLMAINVARANSKCRTPNAEC